MTAQPQAPLATDTAPPPLALLTRESATEPTTPEPSGLRFEATVPRSTVHRAAIAEVFLTDSAIVGPDSFEVAAQLPRRHFMNENATSYDLLLAIEVARQAGVLVAHRYYFVPLNMQFIFHSLQLATDEMESLRIGSRPAQLIVSIDVDAAMTRNDRLRGLDFTGTVTIDGRPAFSATGSLRVLAPSGYRALRTRGREAKLSRVPPRDLHLAAATPEAVGRRDAGNVVITEPVVLSTDTVRASVVSDTTHPHMFDHALDHLPGNLEIEACRQAAVAAVSRLHGVPADSLVASGVTAEFGSFAELDLPTRVDATVGDLGFDREQGCYVAPVTTTLMQSGEAVISAEILIAQWA